MIGIYKITNPIGLIYIGKSINIKSRLSSYRSLNCKGQPLLFCSLSLYGFSNHLIEVIDVCDECELSENERFYIKYYDSCNIGLNCSPGNIKRTNRAEIEINKAIKSASLKEKRLAINKRKKYDTIFRIKCKK